MHILDALVLQENDASDGGDTRGITSSALWECLGTTCLQLQRPELASLCDSHDLEGTRIVLAFLNCLGMKPLQGSGKHSEYNNSNDALIGLDRPFAHIILSALDQARLDDQLLMRRDAWLSYSNPIVFVIASRFCLASSGATPGVVCCDHDFFCSLRPCGQFSSIGSLFYILVW